MAEGRLKEVEEDAAYITNKRIQEHFEAQSREAERRAREEEKSKKDKKDAK